MTSVGGNGWNGNSGNFSNKINDHLSQNGSWEQVGVTVGGHLSSAEKNLQTAYSLSADDPGIKDLAKKLGLSSDISLEGLRAVVKSRFESAQRSFSMLNQIMTNAHQTMMGIIQSIRAR